MEKVIIAAFVFSKLDDIVDVLYEDEYYGFKESAKEYGKALFDFMLTIPKQKYKSTKNPRFGKYYCKFKHDRGTFYFITFDTEDGVYLIKNIFNNHTPDYPTYISGDK